MRNIKPWMLLYTILFACFSYSFIKDDFDVKYHPLFISWSILDYLLATLGNLFYSVGMLNSKAKNIWKGVFFLLILHFLSAVVLDLTLPDVIQRSMGLNILVLAESLVLFFPTFRAAYILGYGPEMSFPKPSSVAPVATRPKGIVVGFWLRLMSDFLDSVFLGLFGMLLAIPFKHVFLAWGEDGLWIGIIIAFLYTGILQSSIGQGQSLAKKLLRLQVVSLEGSYLSLGKSFARNVVLLFICYADKIGAFISNATHSSLIVYAYGTAVAMLVLGTIILMSLHPLKRGVQDLIAGSLVVRKGRYDKAQLDILNDPARAKRAFATWGISCLIVLVFVCIAYRSPLGHGIDELRALSGEIDQNGNLKLQELQVKRIKNKNGLGSGSVLRVVVFLSKDKFDDERLRQGEVKNLMRLLREKYPQIEQQQIVVKTGYNIGITCSYRVVAYSFDGAGKLIQQSQML